MADPSQPPPEEEPPVPPRAPDIDAEPSTEIIEGFVPSTSEPENAPLLLPTDGTGPSGFHTGTDRAPGGCPAWKRSLVPLAGLALFAGSVYALFAEGGWPSWRFGANASRPIGAVSVVIDPGHGGDDSGAVAQGVVEKDLNLDVGRRVAHALTIRGITVRLTRDSDYFVTLEDRVRMGNSEPGAIFVSIHFNDASGDGRAAVNRASGIETFYSEHKAMAASEGGWMWTSLYGAGAKADPAVARDFLAWSVHEGESLASAIQGSLVMTTAAADRGIKERSLYATRRVRGPAVLVEGGFVSHPAEARLLGDPAYRQKLAESIADGIVKYLNDSARQPVPTGVLASLGS